MPWKNNDKDRCLPSLHCCMAWDAQAGSSAGVRGCTLRAAGPGTAGTMARQPTPGPGASPAGYHTELTPTVHHPLQDSPVGVWHILCVLPLAASGRSFTSCGTCKLKPELHSPPQGGKHSQIFLQQETPESFFFPPAASFHCCLCPISPALGFCPPAILQGAHTTHPLRREGREP